MQTNQNESLQRKELHLDLNKIDFRTMHELRRRGHSNDAIAVMTPEIAFKEYCAYLGILNPDRGPTKILENLRSAALGNAQQKTAPH